MLNEFQQLNDWITAIQTPFYPGIVDEPFVTVFLLFGDSIILFDSGLPWTPPLVLQAIHAQGRRKEELRLVLHSHAHYDHIGGAALIRAATSCLLAVHANGVSWFQDHDKQFREFYQAFPDAWQPSIRDTRDFFVMIGIPVNADLLVSTCTLRLAVGRRLECVSMPGHLASCIAIFEPEERILFTGDAFQGLGFFSNWPQYEDVPAYVETLSEIERLKPEVLLTAHSAPLTGSDIPRQVQAARDYLAEIELTLLTILREAKRDLSLRGITEQASTRLGKPYTIQGLITVDAHLRHLAAQGFVERTNIGWKAK